MVSFIVIFCIHVMSRLFTPVREKPSTGNSLLLFLCLVMSEFFTAKVYKVCFCDK